MTKIFAALLLFSLSVSAQKITKDTVFTVGANSLNVRMTYDPNQTDSNTLIVNINGAGEDGTNAALNRSNGPHKMIQNGWDGSVTLPNGVHHPVIVTIQPLGASGNWLASYMTPFFNAVFDRFPKTRKRGAHFIGMSQGFMVGSNYFTQKPTANDYTYIKKFTAAVNIMGQASTSATGATPPYPDRYGHWAKAGNNKILYLKQWSDGTSNHWEQRQNVLDSAGAGSFGFIWSKYGDWGHNNWDQFYSPTNTNWTASNPDLPSPRGSQPSTYIPAGLNIYGWLLMQGDTTLGVTAPPATTFPTITVNSPSTSTSTASLFSTPSSTPTAIQWTKFKVPGQPVFKVSVVGSSTSAGTGASTLDSSFVRRLRKFYIDSGLVTTITNFSVGGTNPTQVDIPEFLASDPDVLLVCYPTNGFSGTSPITEIAQQFQTIKDSCDANGIVCYISGTQPRDNYTETQRIRLNTINDTLRLRFGANFIDFMKPLLNTTGNLIKTEFASGDGVHLNNTGHRVLFEVVKAKNIFQTLVTTGATISTPTTQNTNVTGLSNGVTLYQAGFTDASGFAASAVSTVTTSLTAPPTVNAGADFWRALSMSPGQTIQLTGTASGGTVEWTQVSGPTDLEITNSSTLTPTLSGTFADGYYTFSLTATENGQEASDEVTVYVRDLMLKNTRPCRTGTKQKFTIGNTINGSYVTTTGINLQYIFRDNLFNLGTDLMGGDTIAIARNPNNGGNWNYIEMGDVGGNFGCKVVVTMADTVVAMRHQDSYFRLGARDSNIVAHVKVDGLAMRDKGITYGFQMNNEGIADVGANYLFTSGAAHHLEICGMAGVRMDVGFFIKVNSDSTKPNKIYDNFRFRNIHIHDCYIKEVDGEGFYIGHTDVAGNIQGGNNGPTVIGDSLLIERIIIDSTGWDGVQVSNWGNDNIIRDVVAYRTGQQNYANQQHSILLGGNSQGHVYNNVAVNATGSMAILGRGYSTMYNNFIDSVDNANTNADAVYIQQGNQGVVPPYDSLQVSVYNNIIGSSTRHGIFIANNGTPKTMKKGSVRNNILMDGPVMSNIAGDTLTNNITNASYNYDSALANHKAYQVYKLLRANPGKKVSFFDLDDEVPPAEPPTRAIRKKRAKIRPVLRY